MALAVRPKRLTKAQQRVHDKEQREEYLSKRIDDFRYYIMRADLSVKQISSSTGINLNWMLAVKHGNIKNPADERISVIIAFVKDYERLQTYYTAMAK